MRYLVGYAAHDRGRDALRLGVALAQAFGAELDVAVVLRRRDPHAPAYPPVGHTEEILAAQAEAWLQEAGSFIPPDLPVRTLVRFAPSVAAGLEATAQEVDAGLIVIGGSSASLVRRHVLGAVASTLLHSSTFPVALAPRGYTPSGPIAHIDVAVGTRPGAQQVVDEAIEVAARRGLPARLVTLLDGSPQDTEAAAVEAEQHVRTLLDRALAQFGSPPSVDVRVAAGSDVPDAVRGTSWEESAVLLIGSSRLAGPRRLFLGSTASRMLRELSVPVVVVPHHDAGRFRFDGAEASS